VATDDLNTPLGLGPKPAKIRYAPTATRATVALLAVVLAVFAAWALLANNPLGGEPMAIVNAGLNVLGEAGSGGDRRSDDSGKMTQPAPPGETSNAALREAGSVAAEELPAANNPTQSSQNPTSQGAMSPALALAPGERIVNIIDGKSGARQEVRIAPKVLSQPGEDSPLVEMTRNGPVPRVSPDGRRAAEVYAQPVSVRDTAPQIAIVVTGLGISANATTEAMNKLPKSITFAFSPYGADIDRIAAKARGLGHELLVQVPMEPLDYPENDPGPETLLTSLPAEQNVDRLQWAMSRMQGYVGVANQMGARFTASEMAFSPVLREIGKRGLIFVDDGSSPRSLASQIAGGNSLSFAKGDVTIDAVLSSGEIDRALGRLESVARENGIAVGVAGPLPVAIERIVRWAKTAESRGFALVPITAAAARGRPG